MPAAKKITAKKKEVPLMEVVKIATKGATKKDSKKIEGIVDKIQTVLDRSLDEIIANFDQLTLAKKTEIARDFLPYVTPKMAQTDVNTNTAVDPLGTQLGKLARSIQPEED